LLESLRNLESLIDNVKVIEQNNNTLVAPVTLNVKVDAFLRYEEDLMSNHLDEFQEISELIGKIQIAKIKSQWWCPTNITTPPDIATESKSTLSDLLSVCINLVDILSKKVSGNELKKIGKDKLIAEAKSKLAILKKTQQKFTLIPPYEEWPYPRTDLSNQGLL